MKITTREKGLGLTEIFILWQSLELSRGGMCKWFKYDITFILMTCRFSLHDVHIKENAWPSQHKQKRGHLFVLVQHNETVWVYHTVGVFLLLCVSAYLAG